MQTTRRDNRNRILRTGESQRKDGRYAFKYTDPSGKQHFIYSWKLVSTDRVPKGKRECEALREMEGKVRRDLEDGIDRLGRRMTVCQLYSRYIRCKGNVRPGTRQNLLQLMRLLDADEIGARPIESIRPTDAKGWALRMAAKGYAYATIANYKRSLKAAFHAALEDDLVRRNPFDFKLAEVLENDTVPKVPLTSGQVEELLCFLREDAVSSRYHDEVVVLLGTGLRISELCGLTRADIDLEACQLQVKRQLLRGAGRGLYVAEPKTGSGVRSIYVDQPVREAFARILARRRPAAEPVIDGVSGFLFLNTRGLPRCGHDYAQVFRRMVGRYQRSGRPPLPEVMTAHTLRHTFCTKMAMAGMNPKALQYVMGHSSINMTLGYYAHATSEAAVEEMRRVLR